MNKVSIVVPIYNAQKTLETCIESLIGQTYKNIEIILINDGSTDKSDEICNKYKIKDKRIKYISKKNEGISKTRNTGLKHITGDYLCWCDSDDFYNENYISILLNEMKKNNEMVICRSLDFTDLHNIPSNNEKDYYFYSTNREQFIMKVLTEEQFGGVLWNKMFNIKIIKNNSICFNELYNIGEDLDFVLRYADYCSKIAWSPIKLYNHYINPESITHVNKEQQLNNWNKEIQLCKGLIEKYANNKTLYECAIRRYIRINLDLLKTTKRKEYKKNIKQYIKIMQKSNNIKLKFKIKTIYYCMTIKGNK